MHSATQKKTYMTSANVTERAIRASCSGSARIWTEMQYPRTATRTRSAKATRLRVGSKLKRIEPEVKSRKRQSAARNGTCRRMGGRMVRRNSPCGPERKMPMRRTRGAKTRNGVRMNGPCAANRSMRSAPISPILPTNKMYRSFRKSLINEKSVFRSKSNRREYRRLPQPNLWCKLFPQKSPSPTRILYLIMNLV